MLVTHYHRMSRYNPYPENALLYSYSKYKNIDYINILVLNIIEIPYRI